MTMFEYYEMCLKINNLSRHLIDFFLLLLFIIHVQQIIKRIFATIKYKLLWVLVRPHIKTSKHSTVIKHMRRITHIYESSKEAFPILIHFTHVKI